MQSRVMKTLVLAGSLNLALVSTSGQGTFNFANAAFGQPFSVSVPEPGVLGLGLVGLGVGLLLRQAQT